MTPLLRIATSSAASAPISTADSLYASRRSLLSTALIRTAPSAHPARMAATTALTGILTHWLSATNPHPRILFFSLPSLALSFFPRGRGAYSDAVPRRAAPPQGTVGLADSLRPSYMSAFMYEKSLESLFHMEKNRSSKDKTGKLSVDFIYVTFYKSQPSGCLYGVYVRSSWSRKAPIKFCLKAAA